MSFGNPVFRVFIFLGVLGFAAPVLPLWQPQLPAPTQQQRVIDTPPDKNPAMQWDRYSLLFNTERLPEKTAKTKIASAPIPKLDPTVELRKWQVNGIVMADGIGMATLEKDGKNIFLKTGSILENAEVTRITANMITFKYSGDEVSLTLKALPPSN